MFIYCEEKRGNAHPLFGDSSLVLSEFHARKSVKLEKLENWNAGRKVHQLYNSEKNITDRASAVAGSPITSRALNDRFLHILCITYHISAGE